MADWHGYVLVTVTTLLTNQQKRNIRDRLLELGKDDWYVLCGIVC
jgi:hypothetical protein